MAAGPEALAQRIAASRHLIFGGIQAYHGGTQHLRSIAERTAAIGSAQRETGHEDPNGFVDDSGRINPPVRGGISQRACAERTCEPPMT